MTIETRANALELRFVRPTSNRAADAKAEDTTSGQIGGYAAVYNSDSEDLGGFVEQVAPGAFARSLEDAARGDANIFGFWGHDPNEPIASTRSKTLTLESDATGLGFTMDPARLNPMQLAALEAGDMRMSFGFRVREDHWEERADGLIQRTLTDVELFEVSPVTFPAYPDTSAAKRGFDAFMEARSATSVTTEETEETVEETVETVEPKFNARAMQAALMERGLKNRLQTS